jgi:hypothetical protein
MSEGRPCGKVFNAVVIAFVITSILVSSTLTSMIIPISENTYAYNRNQVT